MRSPRTPCLPPGVISQCLLVSLYHHESDKPLPFKSILCSSDVRWAALFRAHVCRRAQFLPFQHCLPHMAQALQNVPKITGQLLALLTETGIKEVKMRLAFVAHYRHLVCDLGANFQKQ